MTTVTRARQRASCTTRHHWLADAAGAGPSWTIADLEAAKAGRTVSVVLPALNEEETVASVVGSIEPLLGGLVDELVVLDSGSTDDTAIRHHVVRVVILSAPPRTTTQPAGARRRWRFGWSAPAEDKTYRRRRPPPPPPPRIAGFPHRTSPKLSG